MRPTDRSRPDQPEEDDDDDSGDASPRLPVLFNCWRRSGWWLRLLACGRLALTARNLPCALLPINPVLRRSPISTQYRIFSMPIIG